MFAQTEALLWDRCCSPPACAPTAAATTATSAKLYSSRSSRARIVSPSPRPGLLDEVKLRVAYGETGNQPLYGQKFTTLNSASIVGLGGFPLGGTRGFADIRPERQRELEGGHRLRRCSATAPAGAHGIRAQHLGPAHHAHAARRRPDSRVEVYNGASMRVRGFEAVVNAFPLQGSAASRGTRGSTSAMNRATITELPVPPFLFSTPQVGAVQIKEGQVGDTTRRQRHGRRRRDVSRHHVPLVDPAAEATFCSSRAVGNVVAVYMGDGNPDYTAGLGNEVRWKGLSLYGLFDRQQGGMVAAGTWRHFDLGQNSRDFDDPSPDPTKPFGKWRTRHVSPRHADLLSGRLVLEVARGHARLRHPRARARTGFSPVDATRRSR